MDAFSDKREVLTPDQAEGEAVKDNRCCCARHARSWSRERSYTLVGMTEALRHDAITWARDAETLLDRISAVSERLLGRVRISPPRTRPFISNARRSSAGASTPGRRRYKTPRASTP